MYKCDKSRFEKLVEDIINSYTQAVNAHEIREDFPEKSLKMAGLIKSNINFISPIRYFGLLSSFNKVTKEGFFIAFKDDTTGKTNINSIKMF